MTVPLITNLKKAHVSRFFPLILLSFITFWRFLTKKIKIQWFWQSERRQLCCEVPGLPWLLLKCWKHQNIKMKTTIPFFYPLVCSKLFYRYPPIISLEQTLLLGYLPPSNLAMPSPPPLTTPIQLFSHLSKHIKLLVLLPLMPFCLSAHPSLSLFPSLHTPVSASVHSSLPLSLSLPPHTCLSICSFIPPSLSPSLHTPVSASQAAPPTGILHPFLPPYLQECM